MASLRQHLLNSAVNGPWDRFGRWYFAENARRSISPWSTVSLQEYVESLIQVGDRESLVRAAALAHDQPAWLNRIAQVRANSAAGSGRSQ